MDKKEVIFRISRLRSDKGLSARDLSLKIGLFLSGLAVLSKSIISLSLRYALIS